MQTNLKNIFLLLNVVTYKTQLCRCHIHGQSLCWHFVPRFMICEWEKLPLGLAPPTMRMLPFPPSSDGINVQVWPTLTPGALPLGIKEYLLTTKQFQQNKKKLAPAITSAMNWSEFTYHIPSLGLFRGSSTGRNSMAVKDTVYEWTSCQGSVFSGDGAITNSW